MTGTNRTPYLRLTPIDVQFLVELFDAVDECPSSVQLYDLCKDDMFSKLMIQMDDFLIKAERNSAE